MQLLKAPIDCVCWWVLKLLIWSMSQLCGTRGLISDSNINSPCKLAGGRQLTLKTLYYVPIPKYNVHILLLVPSETVCSTETILEFMTQIVSNKDFATASMYVSQCFTQTAGFSAFFPSWHRYY